MSLLLWVIWFRTGGDYTFCSTSNQRFYRGFDQQLYFLTVAGTIMCNLQGRNDVKYQCKGETTRWPVYCIMFCVRHHQQSMNSRQTDDTREIEP